MRKLLLFILFLTAYNIHAQEVANRFVTGRVVHTQVGGGVNYFDVSCNFLDEAGYFDGTNVNVGDKLFISDGGFGYYLPITQIIASSYSTIIIRVNSTGLPLATVPTGIGYLTRGSPTYKFKPLVSGISNADQQLSFEEFTYSLDSILKFKLVEKTSGSTPPAYSPSSTQSWIAQNANGDVYKFNGTSWSLVGGLVNTSTPLTGDGTVGSPVTLPNNSIGPNQIISSGVAAGTYGSASQIPTFTVDQDGRITSASLNNVIDGTANNEGILGIANGGGGSAIITSNTSGASGVSVLPGTGITLSTLTASNGGGITINADDASITNEGRLGVGGTGTTTRVINSNTSGNVGVSIVAGTGMSLSAVNSSNGGSITFNNTGDLSTSNEGILALLPFGVNGGRITSNTSGSGSPKFVGTGNTTITVNNDTMFINTTSGISSVFTTSPIIGNGTTGNRIRLDTTGLGENEYFMVYNGSVWGAGNILTGNGIAGNGTSNDPLTLDNFGATSGQTIKWNGSAWIAANDDVGFVASTPLTNDLTGNLPNPTVAGIRNVPVSTTAPTLNQILKFNGTQYVPAVDTFRWALKAPNGTATAPSYTFDASQGSGMYAVQGAIPRIFLIGASSNSSTRGTGINITAGANSSTGQGGAIAFSAGASTSSSAGTISFNAGNSSSSGSGGSIIGSAGNSVTGVPGNVSFTAGSASSANNGGGIGLTAGAGVSGGEVVITAGNSITNASGANVVVNPGAGPTSQGVGKLIVNGSGILYPSYTRSNANALLNKQIGQTVYITNDTATSGKIGGLASWNGTEWLRLYNETIIDSVKVFSNSTGISVKVNNTTSNNIKVQPNSISTTGATSGQVLTYDGTNLIYQEPSVYVNSPLSGSGTPLLPLGVLNNSIDSTKLRNYGISVLDIGQNGASLNQILKWNGTQWAPAVDASLVNGTYGDITVSGSANVWDINTGVVGPNELASTSVTAGTYGTASSVPSITVDSDGRITAVSLNTVIDGSITNEGIIGVADGSGGSMVITSNTSTANGVSIVPGTGIGLSRVTNTNGGSITITNTGDTNAGDDITTSTTLGGDLSGNLPNPTVTRLRGRTISNATPTVGQIYSWNGTEWALTSVPVNATVTYATLVSLINSSSLITGSYYLISDFATSHYRVNNQSSFDARTASVEPLLVYASTSNNIASVAYSQLHPTDVINYDWNPANWLTDKFYSNGGTIVPNFKGVIFRRQNPTRNIDCSFDYRNMLFARWAAEAPAYSNTTTYNLGDFVLFNSAFYSCLENGVVGESPSGSPKWLIITITTNNYYYTFTGTNCYFEFPELDINDVWYTNFPVNGTYADFPAFVVATSTNVKIIGPVGYTAANVVIKTQNNTIFESIGAVDGTIHGSNAQVQIKAGTSDFFIGTISGYLNIGTSCTNIVALTITNVSIGNECSSIGIAGANLLNLVNRSYSLVLSSSCFNLKIGSASITKIHYAENSTLGESNSTIKIRSVVSSEIAANMQDVDITEITSSKIGVFYTSNNIPTLIRCVIGDNFQNNTAIGMTNCTFKNQCGNNNFGTGSVSNIIAGNVFTGNTFSTAFSDCTVGDNFSGNTIGSMTRCNAGNNFENNVFETLDFNNFGSDVKINNLWNIVASNIGTGFQNNTPVVGELGIISDCTIGNNSQGNTIKYIAFSTIASFSGNTGIFFDGCTIGGNFTSNTFNPATSVVFTTFPSNFSNVDFSTATVIYNAASKIITVNTSSQYKITYYNSSNVLVLANLTD